jgi:Bacterial membrane protein YfhO
MSDTTDPGCAEARSRAFNWFTPWRFGLLLALLIFAAFPQVLLGPQTFVVRDYGFFSYPAACFQQECFRRGQLPFWDPYNNCGVPFLAQWNTMPLYPPALIYLLLPLTWSLPFFCLLHLWFAGFGMFQLARRWTGSHFAAAFAGVAFAFNGLTLNLLMWPSHIATLSWMPWVVLTVEGAWREGGRKIFLAALVGAMQMLAGGPETIFLTWVFLLILWLQQFAFRDRGARIATSAPPRVRVLRRFPVIVALVILLAAAQLLPFLDLAAHSERHGNYADLRWSVPAWGWVNFLVPMAFGSTSDMGVFFQYGQNWTSSYYLGLGTLWLALLAVWTLRDRRVWLLAGCAVAALLFAFGEHTPVYPALRRIIPQLNLITYPVKYLTLMAFIVPLLAAYALARLAKASEHGGLSPLSQPTACHRASELSRRIRFIGFTLLALIGVILFWTWRFAFPADEVRATLFNGLTRVLFLLVTGGVLLFLARRSDTAPRRFAPVILILIAWLDVLTHEPTQNPTVPPLVYTPGLAREKLAMKPQPELGGSRAMLSPMAEWQFVHSAITNPRDTYLVGRLRYGGDANLLDAVPKVNGFFSLTPRENDDVLSIFYSWTNADLPRLEDFLGVSQISAPDPIYHWQSRSNFLPLVTAGQKPVFLDDGDTLRALKQSDFDGRKIVFLPPDARPFVTVTNQTRARVVNSHFENQSVDAEIEAAKPSLVVISQTYYHNWHADVDGQPTPLLRANEAFQAVQIPAGRHELRLAYEDRAFEIGVALTLAAWLVCLIALWRWPRGKSF